MANYCISLALLLLSCAALQMAGVNGLADLDIDCSRPDQSPLHFDLFMELLSNHTTIARELKRAPVFGDMDPDIPAYVISGQGFHISDAYMSRDIRRALCANNEVTMYASMYLTEVYSSGTLLEIASGHGARLPVFGMYFNAAANEIMFTYRHQGVPHTISVDQRLHTGRWRQYAFVLSGHLLEFYYDCELVFSDIVTLPDFCVEEESFVVAFADDSEGSSDVAHGDGVYGFFENVGFFIGRGGLSKQCPRAGKECPTCGQYLKLVERAYSLHNENDNLKQENEFLKAEIDRLTSGRFTAPAATDIITCDMDRDNQIVDGEFIIVGGGICYCRGGELSCDPNMICENNLTTEVDNATETNCDKPCDLESEICINGTCTCVDGYLYDDNTNSCVDQMCRDVNGEDLFVEEESFLYEDGDDMCRIFTCMNFSNTLLAINRREDCRVMEETIATVGCRVDSLDEGQRNMSLCCQDCMPCDFYSCPYNAHCVSTDDEPMCVCDAFYEMNDRGDCIDIDECTEYPMICGYNTMCINEVVNHTKGFTCHCLQGYEESVLGDCEVDIDECIPGPCPINSICNNTIGSFTCECLRGFEKISDGECSPVCNEPCHNGGTCIGPDTCECLPGYNGAFCADDINECTMGTDMCTHRFSQCVNTIGGHFCRCKPGYQGNGTFCEDVNECESDIHNCVMKGPDDCINTEGSYVCTCDGVFCTGACRRRMKTYDDGQSFIDETNECRNCTCLNGEIFCHLRNCDGSCEDDEIINRCCSKCKSRDCYLELDDHDGMIVLRPNSLWVHPKDPCTQWHCDSKLNLTQQDLTLKCPPLQCAEKFRVHQMGRCCPICLLPPCTEDHEGMTLPIHNGCQECTCENEEWSCHDVVECPPSDCPAEDILFYEDRCCPVCESEIFGSTCQTFTHN